MDSTSLLLNLLAAGHTVFGISFRYGQKHVVELEFLARNLLYLAGKGLNVRHEVVDMSSIGRLFRSALLQDDWEVPLGHYEQENMRETVVPNRNAIFASIAYGWALSIGNQYQQVVQLGLGVHSGDHAIYPDCRPEFYQDLWKAFQSGNWDYEHVELYLPYLNADKAMILRDAQRTAELLGLDFDQVFSNTLTSYQPGPDGAAHGLTGSDVERILAFHTIGRRDPIEYSCGWEKALAQALDLANTGR